MATEGMGLREHLLRPDQERPVGADLANDFGIDGKRLQIAARILEADDLRQVGEAPDKLRLEHDLHHFRHVVKEQRQRQPRHERPAPALERLLACREVVGGGGDDRGGAAVSGKPGQRQAVGKDGVADPDEHRHATGHLLDGALDDGAADRRRERRAFAGRAKDKQAMDAAGEDMLDKPLEAADIECVAVDQRRRQRRDDAVEARGSVTHGGHREGKREKGRSVVSRCRQGEGGGRAGRLRTGSRHRRDRRGRRRRSTGSWPRLRPP